MAYTVYLGGLMAKLLRIKYNVTLAIPPAKACSLEKNATTAV